MFEDPIGRTERPIKLPATIAGDGRELLGADYPHYVTDSSGRIYSGWESSMDARDALLGLRDESPGIDAKVQSAVGFERQRGRRPLETDWMENQEVVSRVREGQYGRPPVRGADLEPYVRATMAEMPEYSLLNSEAAQQVLREAGPEETDRIVRALSDTWTDEFGQPNSPGQVEMRERMILEKIAYGSRSGGGISPGSPAFIPPEHEYYDIEDRPTPKDEYARGMTRESFGEAAEKGMRAAGKALPKLAKALLGGALMEVAGEVAFPQDVQATGITHEDPFEYGYYPRHLSPEQGKKWRERQEEAERLKNDPVFQGLMPDPATGRMAGAEFGSAPTKTPPRPVEDADLVGGMPRRIQRSEFK
jgi:hypothetical protein